MGNGRINIDDHPPAVCRFRSQKQACYCCRSKKIDFETTSPVSEIGGFAGTNLGEGRSDIDHNVKERNGRDNGGKDFVNATSVYYAHYEHIDFALRIFCFEGELAVVEP